jgi:hypothetical protein
MNILLMIHSILRWLIVIIGLVVVVKFLAGWAQKKAFSKMDRGLSAGFSGLMDLQMLLGFIYFFVTGLGGAGFPLFRIEHMGTMLVAAVIAHAPAMFRKRDVNPHLVGLLAVVGALVLVVIGVAVLPGGWNR